MNINTNSIPKFKPKSEPNPKSELTPTPTHLSAKIKELRTSANLTQTNLAEKTGYEITSIGSWERGKYIPSRRGIEKIADALDLSLKGYEELVGAMVKDMLEKRRHHQAH